MFIHLTEDDDPLESWIAGRSLPAGTERFGAEGYDNGSAALVNSLRSWNEAYGAELVAHWRTMLQFVVGRPPVSFEQTWDLAAEHEAVGNSTLAPVGVSIRSHAANLVGLTKWFLHDRP